VLRPCRSASSTPGSVEVPADPGQSRYLVDLTRVVRRLGREGRAVLVGRGANYVLYPAARAKLNL
jgi:hypothetical protein